METIEVYCEKALEMGNDGAKVIDPSTVATAEWVRMKCQFGCPRFGRRLCCPPYSPTPDVTQKVMDSYQKAILVYQKIRKGERERAKRFSETIVQLEIEVFLAGYYKAWSMGSGPCRLCEECDPTKLCKHGDKARPSMEACGIDVFKTARNNGFRSERYTRSKMQS